MDTLDDTPNVRCTYSSLSGYLNDRSFRRYALAALVDLNLPDLPDQWPQTAEQKTVSASDKNS